MKFHFSKENLNKPQAKLQRSLEILPGACSWSVLLGLIFLSIFFPFSAEKTSTYIKKYPTQAMLVSLGAGALLCFYRCI